MPAPQTADHSRHDLQRIAALAADDLPAAQRIVAAAQLDECPDCLELHADLRAIAGATRTMPAPRPIERDYRLSADQAARLRRGGWLRSLLRPFGAPPAAVRPIAAAFTTIGLAGLLVTTMLPGLAGTAVSAPAGEFRANGGGAAASAAPAAEPVGGGFAPAPSPESDLSGLSNGGTQAGDKSGDTNEGAAGGSVPGAPSIGTTSTPVSLVTIALIGSLALLASGLVLFGLLVAGRRIR